VTELGLRERKKRQTRQLIASTALRQFAERGFERVTVAEVARAAQVSEATVFNYFPTKEDLVYSGLEAFETSLLDAVRQRAPGESVPAAFGRYLLSSHGLLVAGEPEAQQQLVTVSRLINDSPALRARERETFDRYTRSLAGLIAEQTAARPGDVEPWVVANALIGVHRVLVEYVRDQVLAGRHGPRLVRDVRSRAERALALLGRGLAGYPAGNARPRRSSAPPAAGPPDPPDST
jgi:AcrR family transcriptional regulator